MHWLKRQLLSILPSWIYFFVAFSLLRLTHVMLLAHHGLRLEQPSLVLAGSFLVARAVKLADHLRFVRRFEGAPWIRDIVWKTLLYFVAAVLLEILNRAVRFRSLGEALRMLGQPRVQLIQLWLLIFLLGFCLARAFVCALGKDRVKGLLFGHVECKILSPEVGSHDEPNREKSRTG